MIYNSFPLGVVLMLYVKFPIPCIRCNFKLLLPNFDQKLLWEKFMDNAWKASSTILIIIYCLRVKLEFPKLQLWSPCFACPSFTPYPQSIAAPELRFEIKAWVTFVKFYKTNHPNHWLQILTNTASPLYENPLNKLSQL